MAPYPSDVAGLGAGGTSAAEALTEGWLGRTENVEAFYARLRNPGPAGSLTFAPASITFWQYQTRIMGVPLSQSLET